MKSKKILKKCGVALSALLLAGFLTACSSPSSSGGGDANTDPTTSDAKYTVVYGDQVAMKEKSRVTINTMITEAGLKEDEDYTLDEETKTVTLTDSGAQKYNKWVKDKKNEQENYTREYRLIAGAGISTDDLWDIQGWKYAANAAGISDSEYTIDKTNKTITLNSSGSEKFRQWLLSKR